VRDVEESLSLTEAGNSEAIDGGDVARAVLANVAGDPREK
jgi:hypothetical protein